MALGDAINLLLHRAGIGVDVEGDGFGCGVGDELTKIPTKTKAALSA